jgi:hypothetical protein
MARITHMRFENHPFGYYLCGFEIAPGENIPGYLNWQCRSFKFEVAFEEGADVWFDAEMLRWDGQYHPSSPQAYYEQVNNPERMFWKPTGYQPVWFPLGNRRYEVFIDVPGPCPCIIALTYNHPKNYMLPHGTNRKVEW